MEIKENVSSIYHLNRAFMKCKSGRLWKPSVMDYALHMNRYNYILHNRLIKGTYEVKAPYVFEVYEPKRRFIQAPHLVDRIVQSSLCTNYLKEELRPIFLDCNTACQEGKGTDYARELFKNLLRSYYRKHGRQGVVLSVDIKGFFYNIDGKSLHEINRKYISNPWARDLIEQWGVHPDSKGLGLGAETNQYEACLALHPIDNFLKTVKGCKYYVRYQDDIKVVLKTREEANHIRESLANELAKQKLLLNKKKTCIHNLSEWYSFLGFRFTLTKNGKVLMKILKKKISHQRRKAQRQSDIISSDDIKQSAVCWMSNASKGDNYFIAQRARSLIMEIVKDKRELEKMVEATSAMVARLQANQDYIAMMADVELPVEEVENVSEG